MQLTSLLVTLVMQSGVYSPSGPVITFKMQGGKQFEITTDPKASPKTVEQIVRLVKEGFYNRQRVHRVEAWVTQWGAPASKDEPLDFPNKEGKMELNSSVGDGGSGKQMPFEDCDVNYVRGIVGIASEGKKLGGDSQLFILKKDAVRLNHNYAVVGKVTKGMEVVDAIKRGDRILKVTVRDSKGK